MYYELTKDGLFGYFGPEVVEQMIELPLVKRHLSALDYCQCKEILSKPQRRFDDSRKPSIEFEHAILGFDALKQASVEEVRQYFGCEKIKDAYFLYYGEYFARFYEEFLALKDAIDQRCKDLPLLLDAACEKKLILDIQGAMAIPLQAFTSALLEQNILLEQIESQLIVEAGKAQKFIATIKQDDVTYKQTVVNLAFSIVRMGLSAVNASEFINVSQSISALAASSFGKIQEKLSAIILDIQLLVINTHFGVLQEAEHELLTTTSLEEIRHRWEMYRTRIFLDSKKALDQVLDGCVNNDDFVRCVIRETLCQHKGLTQETLYIKAAENARQYVKDIVGGLQSQVRKIGHIKDAVLSPEGGQCIEYYFRKICLIDYTIQHEKAATRVQGWLTKKLGHRLSFYFPDVVFQKKWSSEKLLNFFYHGVEYAKQTLTLEEYRERRRTAPVVLGLFRNSARTKQELFANLEEQIPHLGDRLVEELQQCKASPTSRDVFFGDLALTGKTRYCFKRRRLSLFHYEQPKPGESVPTQTVPQDVPSVVLLSHRELSFDSHRP